MAKRSQKTSRDSSRKKQSSSRGASRGHLRGAASGSPTSSADKRFPGKPFRTIAPGRRNLSNYAAEEQEPATQEYLARLFSQHEYEISDTECTRFWEYYRLLRKRNAALDLTRIIGIEATVLKHFIDCALVAEMTELPAPLLDIGSGPGFPGMVLAIKRPELPVILGESRGKRVIFLREVRDALELKNVALYAKSVRADTPVAAMLKDFSAEVRMSKESAAGIGSVVTRAVEVIPATLARVRDLMRPGGRVVLMKGPNCGDEITQAQQKFKGVYKMTRDEHYTLPKTKQNRRLVIFERREG